MSTHRDGEHLYDILRAARPIVQFAGETDEGTFKTDAFTQSAILHQFLVLGEATKRLSDAFREARPEIPWRQMAGMRDRLIHGYHAVDLDLVWQAALHDVPALLDQLEQ